MEDKFVEILHNNVNNSIDRLNEFRNSSNESTLDSTIRYLIHEIEFFKLLVNETKKHRKPYKELEIYVYNENKELIDKDFTSDIIKKYNITTVQLYRYMKSIKLYKDMYYFSREESQNFHTKKVRKKADSIIKNKKIYPNYEVYDILWNKLFEGTITEIAKKYSLREPSIRISMKRQTLLHKKFNIRKKIDSFKKY